MKIDTAIKAARKRITKKPEERREDILEAAVRVFAKKGISRTTVSDITDAAGVAKGTFYLYFASKEHLLGALKERFVAQILDQATTLYSRVGRQEWWTLVDETIETFVDFHLSNKDLIQIIVQEGITPDTSDLFAECERKLDVMFSTGIQAGIEAGVFEVGDHELAARMLHHALDGTLNHAVLYKEEIDRDRFVAAAKEITHKILAP